MASVGNSAKTSRRSGIRRSAFRALATCTENKIGIQNTNKYRYDSQISYRYQSLTSLCISKSNTISKIDCKAFQKFRKIREIHFRYSTSDTSGPLQSCNQSINQSIHQSINLSISQSINQSIHQSIDRSINQSINQSINWSNSQSINQLHDHCKNHGETEYVKAIPYLHHARLQLRHPATSGSRARAFLFPQSLRCKYVPHIVINKVQYWHKCVTVPFSAKFLHPLSKSRHGVL